MELNRCTKTERLVLQGFQPRLPLVTASLVSPLVEGKVSPAQLFKRLRMFGESGKVTFWWTKTAIAKNNGITEARRILGKGEHCGHCPDYAARGWVPLSELILPTQRCECRTNCKCTVEFRAKREDACRVPLRDEKGRFAGCAVGGGASSGGASSGTNTRELQRELRAEIDRERRRIARGFVARGGLLLKPTAPPKTLAPKNAPVTVKVKKPKKKRLPTLRPAGNPNHFQIDKNSKVLIWKDTEFAKFDPTYRARRDRNHEYGVNHDDQHLVLNNHKDVIALQGETVKGVPSYYPKLREMPAQSLFDGLARTMSYVEDKNAPPAPDWKPTFHGKIDKKYVRSKKKPGDYNGMQIHHVDQWAKAKFDDINGRLDRKEISIDQAKTEMRGLLTPDPGNKRTGYHISLEQQPDRNLVVLPSGTHDINSPLYFANHPMGIHPDTGKMEKFGIPKTGDGGREWFNKFRGDFWREYYRKESYVAANEINRRVKAGEINTKETADMWSAAYKKVVDSAEYVRQLRLQRDNATQG